MTVLCSIHDLEDSTSKGFASHVGPVFAVKYDGQIFVYKNECPHLGVNLEFQPDEFLDSEGQLIQCSTHGALFNIEDGHCLSGPCQGDYLTPVEHVIEDDQIVIPK
ncbi:Rieske (2Fe-2S) protein [Reinekea blandensis]|uniref:Rieske [2Fe-2S] region n=1 Tax=Reinekea blandensis MED297 TaxID=314283 RepID=A4BE46_9GAMM|nr:Rieske 2Fe-2S domain-containing protein [Reinekea blandensis]EAR09524.1 Rieske [2Fe-2S] region [Reinekea blandensis MED297]